MSKTHSIIIGGTQGMGLALGRAWAAKGHAVTAVGLAKPTSRVRGIDWVVCDLGRQAEAASLLKRAVAARGPVGNLALFQRFRGEGDPWQGEIDASLTVSRFVIETLAPSFDRRRGGSIVAVASVASFLVAEDQPVGYHVAKAGLVQMVRYYAVKLGPRGIRVNAVSSGPVVKDESRAFYRKNPDLPRLFRKITPLGRMGEAADVVGVVDLLCSEGASFVTGQEIVVDGGLTLRWHGAVAGGVIAK